LLSGLNKPTQGLDSDFKPTPREAVDKHGVHANHLTVGIREWDAAATPTLRPANQQMELR
jgi:hypothetical protein